MPDYKHDLHAVHKKPDEKPKVLHIDIETKSSAEISKSGVRRYVEDKDFAILLYAHRVAVLEEGLSYKPISLPPEDSQFLETKQFSVTEICRIFRVPPHLVADLSRATFSNIEYQSLNFVMHSLTPWLVRIEQGIIKDLLLEEEQDTYFPKFNVDGLLRGDYQSRMNGYATGISNGFLSPNDVHRLENMDLIPAEEGGDDYYLNGGYVKLKDAGVAQQNKAAAVQQNQPKETQPDPEEEPESDNRLSESKPRKNERRRTR